MSILITGASGFIGSKLVQTLEESGHTLTLLSRNPAVFTKQVRTKHKCVAWDPMVGKPEKNVFEGIEAVINLMGESVANKRWSQKQKQVIYDSRVVGTAHLVKGIIDYASELKVMVSSSAIGYYNHSELNDLESPPVKGSAFLSKVCEDWELAAEGVLKHPNTRLAIIRTGVVLGAQGALEKMLPLFKFGLGGVLGSGKQWMNWIHLDDLIAILITALKTDSFTGPIDAVAPENASNATFTKLLAKNLNRPAFFKVPSFALKLIFGEFATELLQGYKLQPTGLKKLNFSFKYPNLDAALNHIVSKDHMIK